LTDNLLTWLNKRGYQPVFVPGTGVSPPELYLGDEGRLTRFGPVADLLPHGVQLPAPARGKLPDIHLQRTSRKVVKGAARFLANALRGLGVQGAPSFRSAFQDTGDFVFSLSGVTFVEVGLTALLKVVPEMNASLIPPSLREGTDFHIAYHYAYAGALEMRRANGAKFEAGVVGLEIEKIFEAKGSAQVSLHDGEVLRFRAAKGPPVAFAYKSARLAFDGERLQVRSVDHSEGPEKDQGPYVPWPGQIKSLEALDLSST
jgi:hypothetical protein